MSIDAMKTALEALEFIADAAGRNAIAALRLAIEQAEKQEPVAHMCLECGGCDTLCTHGTTTQPLYTAPPQRQPLTEGEMFDIAEKCGCASADWIDFARAIERAHGIGNKDV